MLSELDIEIHQSLEGLLEAAEGPWLNQLEESQLAQCRNMLIRHAASGLYIGRALLNPASEFAQGPSETCDQRSGAVLFRWTVVPSYRFACAH
jgi:hypothetical protein